MELIAPGTGLLLFTSLMTILVVVFFIILIRWALRINTIVKLQQKQLDILREIALQQGVDPAAVTSILNRP